MSDAAHPLLAQFVDEARGLLDEAGRNLLAVERTPSSKAPLQAMFRAVHTLKGTSGIFEIGAMTRLLHAAEDLLDRAQVGDTELSPKAIDTLLAALDQVGAWIEGLAGTAALPADAESRSDEWVERLRKSSPAAIRTSADIGSALKDEPVLPSWLTALSEKDLDLIGSNEVTAGAGLRAVTYTPDEHCFYRGEDPVALMRQIGGLRFLGSEPAAPWPGLDALDPFHCNLRMHAVTDAAAAELTHLFRYVPDQVEITEIPADWTRSVIARHVHTGGAGNNELVDQLLRDQRRMLAENGGDALLPGKIAAAGRVVRNLMVRRGRAELADALDRVIRAATEARSAAPLIAAIDRFSADLLSGTSPLPTPTATSAPAVAVSGPTVEAPEPTAAAASSDGRAVGATSATVLRVEQSKVDALMNLIGELVVAKNTLAYLARRAEHEDIAPRILAREIKDRHAVLNRIAEDMQSAVLAVRTLPVDHVFQRFPRLVRDIARRLGKEIELRIEGGETEADKNVIEALADPLIHIVRNSLDHGFEMPGDRLAAGKAQVGTLCLHAGQENDDVVIRIVDDGRGIDPAKVRQKAVEKGVIEAERAAALSDQDAVHLVFAPGFSTAEAVSDLSGRGVGMDAVRSAVERLGGRVTLSSRTGQGTQVELRLPLSMAVMRILTVRCGDRLFGVPMNIVVETVRVPLTSIHKLRDREALVLRDSVVPVVRLARILDLPESSEGGPDEAAILVVRLGGERLGIVVAGFREGMEAIVKPMEGVLADLRGFAGTTLLGDGQVLLVLALEELVT